MLQINIPKIITFFKTRFLYILPFMAWMYAFHGLYFHRLILVRDAPVYFKNIKYYLDNIVRGVYPMWNPFVVWGRPDDLYVRTIGEMNPFLYLIIVFNKLGMSFGSAYTLYLLIYFSVGIIGFYLLAKRLFKDKTMAYLSMLLLMFSSLGATFFDDNGIMLLVVPLIWFFYFLIAFVQDFKPFDFVGLTFVSMIVAITYIPFYFFTIFVIFGMSSLIFFFRQCKPLTQRLCQFIKKNKILATICLLSLCLSLAPGLLWYMAGGSGDYVAVWRHIGSGHSHVASVPLDKITVGGFSSTYSFVGLFSNLSDIHLGDLYFPIFLFILIGLGMIAPLQKRSIILFCTCLVVCIIAMTNVTPVHKFLYENFVIFKLFRNIYYLFWMIIPLAILFIVNQFQNFLKMESTSKEKKLVMIIYVGAVHIGIAGFLSLQDSVVSSSYAVVVLSMCFFAAYFFGMFKGKEAWIPVVLCILVIAQPVEVFHHMVKNAQDIEFSYPNDKFRPIFSYIRPEEPLKRNDQIVREVKDTSGFVDVQGPNLRYVGLQGSLFLHKNIDREILKNYVKYKFVVVDQTEGLKDEADLTNMKRVFSKRQNIAFVDPSAQSKSASGDQNLPQWYVPTKNSDQLQVLQFDINEIKIKTNFPTEKFLVYNDSYHKDWQARINGKPAEILRANIAFKGLWLPKGENEVTLRYRSKLRYALYIFLIFVIPHGILQFA